MYTLIILCYIRSIRVKLNLLHSDVYNDNNVNQAGRIWQYNQHLVIARSIIVSRANKYRNQPRGGEMHYSVYIDKSAERLDVSLPI